MLASFLPTPPPADGKSKKVAWTVAWLSPVVGAVMLLRLLSLVLPPWGTRDPPPPSICP